MASMLSPMQVLKADALERQKDLNFDVQYPIDFSSIKNYSFSKSFYKRMLSAIIYTELSNKLLAISKFLKAKDWDNMVQVVAKLKCNSAYVCAGRIYYTCSFIKIACMRKESKIIVEYFQLLVEHCIDFINLSHLFLKTPMVCKCQLSDYHMFMTFISDELYDEQDCVWIAPVADQFYFHVDQKDQKFYCLQVGQTRKYHLNHFQQLTQQRCTVNERKSQILNVVIKPAWLLAKIEPLNDEQEETSDIQNRTKTVKV